jgi:hypothetical protein
MTDFNYSNTYNEGRGKVGEKGTKKLERFAETHRKTSQRQRYKQGNGMFDHMSSGLAQISAVDNVIEQLTWAKKGALKNKQIK